MKNTKLVLLTAFTACLIAFWVAGAYFYYQSTHSASHDETPVLVEIKTGATLKQVAVQLDRRNLIRSAGAFRLLAYIQHKQNQIKSGEYLFAAAMLPDEILKRITQGLMVLYPVTIPEGFRITEIADLFVKQGLVSRDKFIAETRNPELLKSLSIPADSLEGYLYPDTYYFSKTAGEHTIVKTLVDTFKKKAFIPEYADRAKSLNLSFHQVVTLASLIEKETAQDSERKLIAAVFYNRLRKKMLLQTDPTVIYAIPDFDGNIHKKDLSIDSPYNTYKYAGLPPGPIASPGLKSLDAALFPAQTDYIFFVSRQDGTHEFSTNLDDHNRAVNKFQLHRATG